jgi:hypothetical protein
MTNTEQITFAPPLIDLTAPPPGKWANEYQAFRRLLPSLLLTHRGQFVAIHEGQVIGCGPDKLMTALEAFRQVGNVSIHVGLVAKGPEPVVRSGVRR